MAKAGLKLLQGIKTTTNKKGGVVFRPKVLDESWLRDDWETQNDVLAPKNARSIPDIKRVKKNVLEHFQTRFCKIFQY